jgi:hypothetical protein
MSEPSMCDEAIAVCNEIWQLFEDGQLVRNTSKDHEPGWAMKQIPLVRTLQRLQRVVEASK